MQQCLFNQNNVALNGRFHPHFLHPNTAGIGGGIGQWQIPDNGYIEIVFIDVVRNLNVTAIWQVGNMPSIHQIKVTEIKPD